jgi:uncharacterized protein (TIGR03067 family)
MRACTVVGAVVGIILMAQIGPLQGDPDKDKETERIARLIKQLGDDAFANREAASKELDAIGAPALDALRKAASDDDAEIRRRAEQLFQVVTGRIHEAAAKKELAKWEGSWQAAGDVKMTIKGDRFASSAPGIGARNGKLIVIEIRETVALVDFVVEEGDVKGSTANGILRLEGDTLQYCETFVDARPTEFQTAGAHYYIAWKRVPK